MREGGAEKNGADLRGAPEGFEPSTGFGPPRSLRNGNGIPDSEWEGWGDWEDEPNTYNNDWVSQERWPEGIPPDEAAYLRREERRRYDTPPQCACEARGCLLSHLVRLGLPSSL